MSGKYAGLYDSIFNLTFKLDSPNINLDPNATLTIGAATTTISIPGTADIDSINASNIEINNANSEADIGSEKVTNGDFTTDLTGWTNNGNWAQSDGTALHTAGSTNTLEQDVTVVSGDILLVSFDVTGLTTGTVTMSIGGVNGRPISSNFTAKQIIDATGTGNLIFAPTSDFDGAIDNVSVKIVTKTTAAIMIKNDALNDSVEIRDGGDQSRKNLYIGLNAGRADTGASANVALGYEALKSLISGNFNVALGAQAGKLIVTGARNFFLGRNTFGVLLSGDDNIGIGSQVGSVQQTGSKNIYIGTLAGQNAEGSSNIFIGYNAGIDETAGDTLIVDNQDRSNEAGGRAGALLYGLFNATPASQILSTPGNFGVGVTAPDEKLHILKNQNSGTLLVVENATNDTAASVGGSMRAADATGVFFAAPSNHTSVPIAAGRFSIVASSAALGDLDTAGLNLIAATAAADIQFYTGGVATSNERMRITNTGIGIGVAPLANMASGDLVLEGGSLALKEITTPTADADYGKIYTKNNNELFFQDGAGTEHLLHGDAFSNLWYHGTSTGVTIGTQNAFTKITVFENVGDEDDLGNVVGNATNDEITISSGAGASYGVTFHVSITAAGANREMIIVLGIELATPLDITNVTDDLVSPIVITSNDHGLLNGDMVQIADVVGNTAANGSFMVTNKTTNTFEIVILGGGATTGNGDYNEGSPTGNVTIKYPGNLVMHRLVSQNSLGVGGVDSDSFLVGGDKAALYVANLDAATDLNMLVANLKISREGD